MIVVLLTLLSSMILSTEGFFPSFTLNKIRDSNLRYPISDVSGQLYGSSQSALLMTQDEDLDDVVKKSGLEIGLFKSFTSGDKEGKVTPQELLKKYGAAYLATSITLAIISYATCYILIDNGVDVGALLEKLGINVSDQSSTAGTAAIAYAVHKAASPIRFPPTVALTPVVAGILGKSPEDEEEGV